MTRLWYGTGMKRLFVIFCVAALVGTADDAAARKRRRKGAVDLTSPINGAKVTIDGKNVGKTPLKQIALREGTYTLKVKKLGFLDFSQKVKVKAGKTATVNADLLPFAGVIKVTANVRRAAVLVDGTAVGRVPLEREVGIGRRVITVRAPGYDDYTEEIDSDPGKRYTIQATLGKGGRSEPGGADLALVPLGSSGGAEATDEPALEPLAPPAGDDDLALVPLGSSGGGDGDGTGTAGTGDDLALEALPTEALPPSEDVAAIDPAMMPPGLGTTVEPPKPWYMQWWVWTAAGVVVVTGVSVGVYYATRGEEEVLEVERWQPGDGVYEPDTIPAIIAF